MTAPYRYEYKIGTTFAGMVNLEALSPAVPAPYSTFKLFKNQVALGDGTIKGIGYPSATWTWAFLTNAQRNVLKGYCSGSSASVYIHTQKNQTDAIYDDYLCVMVWPEEETVENHYKLDFTITFIGLVHVTS